MVLAHHGFWLPNEQRGSWSTEVWAPHLIQFGPATKTIERRSLANKPFDRELRKQARQALLYPAVNFNEAQREAIAAEFGEIIRKLDLTVLALAIMPDHTHAVTLRHKLLIEEIIGYLKCAGTRQLTRVSLLPLAQYRTARTRSDPLGGAWLASVPQLDPRDHRCGPLRRAKPVEDRVAAAGMGVCDTAGAASTGARDMTRGERAAWTRWLNRDAVGQGATTIPRGQDKLTACSR